VPGPQPQYTEKRPKVLPPCSGAFSCKACTTAQTVPTSAPISCRIDHDWGIHVAVVRGHCRRRRGRVCVGRYHGQSDFRVSRHPPRPAIDRSARTTLGPSWGPRLRMFPAPSRTIVRNNLSHRCSTLALIHGLIGGSEQFAGSRAVVRIKRHSDARGYGDRISSRPDQAWDARRQTSANAPY
jgi:hypothetical protein